MSKIANTLESTKKELKNIYPNKNIKTSESGESDIRVGSVGATISIKAYTVELTEEDVNKIVKRVNKDIDNRVVDNIRWKSENKVFFDITS